MNRTFKKTFLRALAASLLLLSLLSLSACNPNDCGFPIGKQCKDDPKCCSKAQPNSPAQPYLPGGDYYVMERYSCKDVGTNEDRGSCDVSAYSRISCLDALDGVKARVARLGGDPCKRCVDQITDNSRYVSGREFRHLGPCRGYPGTAQNLGIGSDPVGSVLGVGVGVGVAQNLKILSGSVGSLRALEVAANLTLAPTMTVAIGPPFKCTTDCRAWDETCLRPQVYVATGKPKMEAFAGVLQQTQTGTVNKTEIMKLFGVTSDPCKRGDTIVTAGEFINKGEACDLSLALEFGNGKTQAFISLPEVLHGHITPTKSGVAIRFVDEIVSPGIYTSDRNVNQAWGGVVSEIEANAGFLYIRTTGACVAVRF